MVADDMHVFYVGVKAVVVDEGRVLLLERQRGAGRWWDLPGGRLEAQESINDGLRRELHEEIGADDFKVSRLLSAARIPDLPNGIGLMLLLYGVSIPFKEATLSPEHVSYEWVPLQDAVALMESGSGIAPNVRQAQAAGLHAALALLEEAGT